MMQHHTYAITPSQQRLLALNGINPSKEREDQLIPSRFEYEDGPYGVLTSSCASALVERSSALEIVASDNFIP